MSDIKELCPKARKYKSQERHLQMNFDKKKLRRRLSIFVGLFIVANILLYIIEYKRYVSSAPIEFKEARKDIVNAMMFHTYYIFLVKTVRIDFLNPILKPLKSPRDYFYNKAINQLPEYDAERAIWFDIFEVRPYNFSVSARYGSMARIYGKEFSKTFIDKVYKNIEILSRFQFQDTLTPDLQEDAVEVHIDLIHVYVYDFHLHPKGFLYHKETMEKVSTDFELYKRFENIYNWNKYFLKNNSRRYKTQFKHAFNQKRGWYSPYKNYYDNLFNLSSFILFYKVNNDIFDCSKDKKYLKDQKDSGSAFKYLLKSYPKNSKQSKMAARQFFYLLMPNDLDNNTKNRSLKFKNVLDLRVSCNYAEEKSNRKYYAFSPIFKGLKVGHSTLKDVISVLGEPTGMVNNGRNYVFDKIEMTIRPGKGGINTIIIHDEDFVDLNGYKIGTPYDIIKKNPNVKYPGGTLTERSNGIIYWFKDNRVSRIVYTSGLMLIP